MRWPVMTIQDVAELVTKGTTPTTLGKAFTGSGIRFIKAEALNGDTSLEETGMAFVDEETHQLLKRSILKVDDVLITIAGAQIGRCGFVKEHNVPANTNQAVGIVRVNKAKAFPRFIYYFFKQKSTFDFIQGLGAAQAAQPNLNLANLKQIKFPAPLLDEQRKISGVLSAYDELIEKNSRQIQLLEEAARQLYKEWFVRLRFPGHEQIKVVAGIPEGWEKRIFDDICQSIGGGTPSTSKRDYWDGDIEWVTPSDITRSNSIYLIETENKITDSGLRNSSAKMLPGNAILMTSRASIGFFAIANRPVCTNQGFIAIVPNNEYSREYLLFNLVSRVDELRAQASGTTFKEISKGKFRGLSVLWPPESIQAEFSDWIVTHLKKIQSLSIMNNKLRQARDLLLPRLMNGEIRV